MYLFKNFYQLKLWKCIKGTIFGMWLHIASFELQLPNFLIFPLDTMVQIPCLRAALITIFMWEALLAWLTQSFRKFIHGHIFFLFSIQYNRILLYLIRTFLGARAPLGIVRVKKKKPTKEKVLNSNNLLSHAFTRWF